MKNIRLVIFLIVIICAAGIYFFSNPNGTLKSKNTSFAIKSTDEITGIEIKSGEKKLVLEKKDDNWKVNDKYNVTKWSIENFLTALNRLYVQKPVSKMKKKQVASILKADGINVKIIEKKRRVLKRFYVSKPAMNKDETFMMMHKSSSPFIVAIPSFRGLVADLFIMDENFWRDKTIFNYPPQNIKTITVIYPKDNTKSFELTNFNDGTFAIKDMAQNTYLKNFDVSKVAHYFTYFRQIEFERVVDSLAQKKVDSVINSGPFIRISVKSTNGNENSISIFRKPPENKLDEFGEKARFDYIRAYATMNQNKELISIQYHIFDPLFKEIDYFR